MVSANDNISDTYRFNDLNLSLVSTCETNRQTVCLFVSPPSRSELQPSSGQIFTNLSSNLINIAKCGQQKLWIARMITHQIRIVLFPHRMVPWNQMRKLWIYNVIICNAVNVSIWWRHHGNPARISVGIPCTVYHRFLKHQCSITTCLQWDLYYCYMGNCGWAC